MLEAGIVYSYKGFLLLFGLFLSYETRSIKLKQINDSRLVGMSIYNVVVLCLITAPVALVISAQQDAAFAFVALAIIFCCFLSMALVFIPKLVEVIRHPRDRAESSDAGASKEEEERYHKLVRENDDMQRLIAEKEEKIRILKSKLQDRAATRNRETLNENHVPAADVASGVAGQARLRQGVRPSVRIVTPNSQSGENSQISSEPRISFDISESYL